MNKILIVEDEENIARFVELELKYEGYEVEKAYDGRVGFEMIKEHDYDLILLDIMLPTLNGMEILRRMRQFSQTPVIMVTARDTVVDKVSGLDGGADDYITKPFAIEELLARIRAVLRIRENGSGSGSGSTAVQHLLTHGKLTLEADSRIVKVDNKVVELTKREFDLLQYLLMNQNIVLSRDTLLENVWGFDYYGETNAVDVYVRYLRSKIEEPFNLKFITTVRGVGYVIKDE
ncbi:MAG: response regulator transcription factor [Clostridiales bacterium]